MDSYELDEYRFTTDSVILKQLSDVWERHLVNIVKELPHVALSDLRDDERHEL